MHTNCCLESRQEFIYNVINLKKTNDRQPYITFFCQALNSEIESIIKIQWDPS